jgi:outer membrane protein assembly factor BamA
MKLWVKIVAIATVCLIVNVVRAQVTDSVFQDDNVLKTSFLTIRDVRITGNKVTKKYIISREVAVQKGQSYSISEILRSIELSRQNLMNTTLFVDVSVDFSNWTSDSLDIMVDVKERWYYFPIPYFKPVDRNWNVWINQYNVSMERVNYGLKFAGNNVTGRNDKLNLWLISGYTRQLALSYVRPYIDKKLKHGLLFDISYSKNREINYTTRENQQLFYKNEKDFVREQMAFSVGYSYRKRSIAKHIVRLGYIIENIADTVADLNPKYFSNGKKKEQFAELRYSYNFYNVNYIPYPLKGFTWEFQFLKRGFTKDMNLWQFGLRAAKYWTLAPKTYLNIRGGAILKLPFDQPFYNQPMMGYGEYYLRGLEYYVIDGVAGGYGRTTISREIFSFKLKTGLKSRTYGHIPFKIYIKAYTDAGYVYNKNNVTGNTLTNKFLYTGGIGLDLLTIYDFVLRLEYSFNQMNERALFFHQKEH